MANVLTEASVRNWLRRCGSVKASPALRAGSRRDDARVHIEHEVRVLIQRAATKSLGGEAVLRVGAGGGACKERDRWSDRQERSLAVVLARAPSDFPQACGNQPGRVRKPSARAAARVFRKHRFHFLEGE